MKNETLNFKNIKLLDVTLRDGGYRNQFNFDNTVSKRLVNDLADANIDYIEIGYRNGLSNRAIPVGLTGELPNHYIQELRGYAPHAQFSVMLHPHNVTDKDLEALKALGVSMIRVCLTAPTMQQNIATVNKCKAMGFVTTANIIKVSSLEVSRVMKTIEMLDQSGADVVYIADSFGNLVPQKVAEYIQGIKSVTSKKIGFHAHNNLSLALANAISAIDNGATFIDASVCGMGFGIGNLPMEILAGYIERVGQGTRLDAMKIFKLAAFWSKNTTNSHLPIQSLDVFWGLNNLSSHFRRPVMAIAEQENLSPFDVAKAVAAQKNIKPSEADIRKCLFQTANA